MSDREIPTHSAAWHYSRAEEYLSKASMLSRDPALVGLSEVRLVNPAVQAHYVAMAQVHATLASAGAAILSDSSHNHQRALLQRHAEGNGVRE